MRSKEFYEESISRLQKMVKHGVYVLLFDAFAVEQFRFRLSLLVDGLQRT